jgi:Spy/CpxP family protein refolding chaperone
MRNAEVLICLATMVAMVAPCALADNAQHTVVSAPTFSGPPGTPPPGPPCFAPPVGFARSGGLMWTGPGGGSPMPPPPPLEMPFMMMPGTHGLNLTDQQVESMAAMQRSFRNSVEPIRAKIHQLEDTLQQELYQDSIDAAKVKQLQEQLQNQRSQFDKASADHTLLMVQALTRNNARKRGNSSTE